VSQRLVDYALVALVVLAIFGLFRLSRLIMKSIISGLERRKGPLGPDRMLLLAFLFLLAGLLFLPSVTALLAVIDSHSLSGGMVLHLVLVALSIILFSIAEDLFRDFPALRGDGELWPAADHFRRMLVPFAVFWAAGVIFLSPVFYSGLTLLLAVFYLYALTCRKTGAEPSDADGGTKGKRVKKSRDDA